MNQNEEDVEGIWEGQKDPGEEINKKFIIGVEGGAENGKEDGIRCSVHGKYIQSEKFWKWNISK